MRHIQFRGWCEKHKCWIYGYYAIHHITETDNHDKVIGCTEVHQIFNDKPGERSPWGYWQTVDPKSVGQFIGSCDKHGTPLYEGDIVKVSYQDGSFSCYKVIYNSMSAQFELADRFSREDFSSFRYNRLPCRVVGNIYENPELMNNQ